MLLTVAALLPYTRACDVGGNSTGCHVSSISDKTRTHTSTLCLPSHIVALAAVAAVSNVERVQCRILADMAGSTST
jgi:hypothetical protein